MESDEGLTSLSNNVEIETYQTFSDYADRLCPIYMAMGVSYNEFWNGDYSQFKYYWEKENILNEKKNAELWLLGNYVYDAICAVAPVLVANPRNGAKITPYHKKPYQLNEEEPKTPQEEQNEMLVKFKNMTSRWNENFNKGGVKK